MTSFLERTRFATLLAVGLALVASGVVAGAAGGNFILGVANSAGTSNTSLTTSSTGNALLITQNGSGTAIRGSTGSGSGIAGFFTSGSGSGVSGVVAANTSYGVYAGNDATSTSTGAALRANGKNNKGAVITSDKTNALVAQAKGCSGFLCGADGVSAVGYGFGAGVYADGAGSIAGLYANGGALAAVYAYQTASTTDAVYASSTNGSAINAVGLNGGTLADCDTYFCAGAVATGRNGVLAGAGVTSGAALYGVDQTTGGTAYGLISDGDSLVIGNLSITGTCTGCAAAALAVNSSNVTLRQGEAVTLLGVSTASDGSVALDVGPAKKGDAVLGVVDREMSLSPKTVKIPASQRTENIHGKGEVTVKTAASDVKAQVRKWLTGDRTIAAGATLRVITSGVFTMDASVDAAVGDTLAVVGKAGKLGKAGADAAKGASAGKFLGTLKDGRSVLLVDPS